MYKMILTAPSGHKTTVATNIAQESIPRSLKSARRAYFGRLGKISYTNQTVSCNGAMLSIDKE